MAGEGGKAGTGMDFLSEANPHPHAYCFFDKPTLQSKGDASSHLRDVSESGHRMCAGTPFARVLQPHLLTTKEERRTQAHHRPFEAERLHSLPYFQDGDCPVHTGSTYARAVGGVSGHAGCLLPPAHTQELSEVPSFRVQGTDLAILRLPLRTFGGALGVHGPHEPCRDSMPRSRHPDTLIFGRLAAEGSLSGSLNNTCRVCHSVNAKIGTADQLEKNQNLRRLRHWFSWVIPTTSERGPSTPQRRTLPK